MIFFGAGKNAVSQKFEASTEEERDCWVKAISLMIVFHYRRESDKGHLNQPFEIRKS